MVSRERNSIKNPVVTATRRCFSGEQQRHTGSALSVRNLHGPNPFHRLAAWWSTRATLAQVWGPSRCNEHQPLPLYSQNIHHKYSHLVVRFVGIDFGGVAG